MTARETVAPPPKVPTKTPLPDPIAEECDRGEEKRTSDLCAQWKAADSAYESAVWTRITGIVTAIGLIVGFVTMVAAIAAALFAKDAAREAKRAANSSDDMAQEARAANAVALSTSQANRAWLLPDRVDYGAYENGFIDGRHVLKGFVFVPIILNSGGSPAIKVSVSREFRVENYQGDVMIPEAPTFARRALNGEGLVPPNNPISTNMVVLDDEETAKFRAREVVVFINVQIFYTDIHGFDRETESTYVALHNGGYKGDGTGKMSESISFTLSGRGQRVT